ncbi:MAG: hypothetical protein AB1585_00620 [Thermodesulfobacteriota bacterium]
MLLAEPLQITTRLVQEFEKLGIPYLVGGSLASSLHGIPRATNDVDLVADIKQEHISSLVGALEAEFYIDGETIKEAIRQQRSFNVIHLATMFKIDIFLLKPDSASQEEMKRRERYQFSETPNQGLFMASAEDVIVQKLFWFQSGGSVSERQWTDVLGVLQVQGDQLDFTYLERMARHRGVYELLLQAMKDAA